MIKYTLDDIKVKVTGVRVKPAPTPKRTESYIVTFVATKVDDKKEKDKYYFEDSIKYEDYDSDEFEKIINMRADLIKQEMVNRLNREHMMESVVNKIY